MRSSEILRLCYNFAAREGQSKGVSEPSIFWYERGSTGVSQGLQARRFLVSGLVQGVGFRFFAQHVAENLHVCGWVRNLRDGRVEVVASGTPEQLAKLRVSLERGPRFATVRGVDESEADPNSIPMGHFAIEDTD
jgi:acylphosphatase